MPIKNRFDNYERKTRKSKKTHLMPCYNKYDNYLFYKKDIPHKSKSNLNINKTQFTEIIDLYNLSIKELLKEGIILVLPKRMGGLTILKKELERRPDHKYSYRHGLEDTLYVPLFLWLKYSEHQKALFKNMRLYSFKPTRQVLDEVTNLIVNGNLAKKLYLLTMKATIKI